MVNWEQNTSHQILENAKNKIEISSCSKPIHKHLTGEFHQTVGVHVKSKEIVNILQLVTTNAKRS